jgi:hypothetical protein
MTLFALPTVSDVERDACARFDAICTNLRQRPVPTIWPGTHWTSRFWQEMLSRAFQHPLSKRAAVAHAADVAALEAAKSLTDSQEHFKEAMGYVCQIAISRERLEYSPELFRTLHYLCMQGSAKSNPGCLRRGAVVVHYAADPSIVYRPADAKTVPALLDALCTYLNSPPSSHPLTIAAIAHLNFALLHPFADGNGRVARCLHALVLMRAGLTDPMLCSLDCFLGLRTQDYDDVLAGVSGGSWNPERDVRPWIQFCLRGHIWQAECLRQQRETVQRFWEEADRLIVEHRLPPRIVLTLVDALSRRFETPELVNDWLDVAGEAPLAEAISTLTHLGLLTRNDKANDQISLAGSLERLTTVTVAPPPETKDLMSSVHT